MNESELSEILESDQHETETYDFKEQWENTNSELLKDILSFANTAHHNDCYLIYGVNDNKKVVGVANTDKHRKNQQQISDFLESLDFANVSFPEVNINTLTDDGKEVDILTIKDSDRVPFYLRSDYTNHGPSIRHGEILFRDKDSDFGKQKAPTYAIVEGLWKKHFHLDLTAGERFYFILDDICNWSWHDGEPEKFVYDIDPNFCIEIEEKETPKTYRQVESFSADLPNPQIYLSSVSLKYNQQDVMDPLTGMSLDGGRGFAVYPESSQINGVYYYYYFMNSIKEKIGKLVNNQKKPITDQGTVDQYLSSMVLYRNDEQRKLTELEIESSETDFTETDEEIKNLRGRLVSTFAKEDVKKFNLPHMIKQINLIRYIDDKLSK
ncbi:ATP-binding protein [Liquorilactobacillus satsumensis]|uniref:AlbA family DNA-binding domain-containing protein n=1 Tax=Liquorilactobacillus satsumensis TaxID=259059 RepID=UPI0021C4B97B|nr:ATP-binding protein [Liquorilactobacillus satsumensis]MCP9358635.1 ATP-binding protein [Liquorilactobacillus satsumensis]MCP9372592.1 ATP-binding protein [Liquorilactobacillus satsumensis]